LLAVVLAVWFAVRSSPSPLSLQSPAVRFGQWRSAHASEVTAYLAYLDANNVGGVVPPDQLLRTGRRWRVCGGQEFDTPPRADWPHVVPTLRLLADLRRRGLLGDSTVASGFRTPDYNRCEGGSGASRHLSNRALDLDLVPPTGGVAALCRAWRREGAALDWGLGFYSSTQIHLDTAGFRTWGSDHHSGTSLCAASR
jgi:Peptidase M15